MFSLKMVCVVLLLSCVLFEGVLCQTGLTDADEQEILDAHNSFRGQVSPSAANMERMVEIASYAATMATLLILCM